VRKIQLRKLISLPAIAIATVALAVPALAGTKTVKVGDDWFGADGTRPTVTINKGSSIKWKWVGDAAHNVFVVSGPVKFHSKTKAKGTYTHKFGKKGTYSIVCTIHTGMTMKVKVK
jgi:plastocyanin